MNQFLQLAILLLLSSSLVQSTILDIDVYNQEDFIHQMNIAKHSWATATVINIRFLKD